MEGNNILDQAKKIFSEEQNRELINGLDQLLSKNKSNLALKNFVGDYIFGLAKYKEAIKADEKEVLSVNQSDINCPNEAFSSIELASIMNVLKTINKSVTCNVKNAEAHFDKGMDFYREKCFFKAIESFIKCLSLEPSFKLAHFFKGKSLKYLKLYENALEEFDIEVSINPENAHAYNEKALCLIELRKFELALFFIRTAIEKNSNIEDFYITQCICLLNLSIHDEAFFEIDKLLTNNPSNPQVLKLKAEILMLLGNADQGLPIINKAIELEDKSSFYEIKALILFNLQRNEEAYDFFLDAMKTKDDSNKVLSDKLNEIKNYYKKHIRTLETKLILIHQELNKFSDALTGKEYKEPKVILNPSPYKYKEQLNWNEISIDKTKIINYQEYLQEYLCNICLGLLKSPVCCESCDSLFCSNCLNEAFKFNRKCPHCSKSPFKNNRIIRSITNTLNSIKFNCPFDCDSIITMEKLEKHYKECENNFAYHLCNLCQEKLYNIDQISKHKIICNRIIVKCPKCKKQYTQGELENHINRCEFHLKVCKDCKFKYLSGSNGHNCKLMLKLNNNLTKIFNCFYDVHFIFNENYHKFKVKETIRFVSEIDDVSKLKDGKVAISSKDKMINLWNFEKRICLKTLTGHKFPNIFFVELKDEKIATISDFEIRIWTIKEGECLKTINDKDKIRCIVELDDGIIASGHENGNIKYWNILTGESIAVLDELNEESVYDLTYLKNGKLIIELENLSIKLLDVHNQSFIQISKDCSENISLLKVLEDGKIALGFCDGDIKICNNNNRIDCFKTLIGHTKFVKFIIELKDGKIASASNDKYIKIWDITTGKCIRTIRNEEESIESLIQLSGGNLACLSKNGVIAFWDPSTGNRLNKLTLSEEKYDRLIDLNNGEFAAVASKGIILCNSDTK